MQYYLNHAASSFPKPTCVAKAMHQALMTANHDAPGRGHHDGDILWKCRASIARLLGVHKPEQIILTPSATHGINTVITGLLRNGGHVITSTTEHNSVLRPLYHAQKDFGAQVTFCSTDESALIDVDRIRQSIRKNTCLIAVSAASNVTGTIQPIDKIASLAASVEIPLLIDAAQYIGCIPFNYSALPGRVFVVFAGHKALLGPAGTGGLIVPDNTLPQSLFGGTGIRSELLQHPEELPLRHEAGTPNIPGFIGLAAAVDYLLKAGIETGAQHKHQLVTLLRDQIKDVPGVQCLPLANNDGRAGIVSFTLSNMTASEAGYILADVFLMLTRTGLHCAPQIHRHFKTFPEGTVRISFGADHPLDTATECATAIQELAGMVQS
ncbi:MAG: aminotransferase class V-fold PLP-dependent enzyme [Deltaproteobacteria bacterium]|nr:aminotransferase class V-fold PLP-dependent enzyme [Deltaproteobacteria bacterium]